MCLCIPYRIWPHVSVALEVLSGHLGVCGWSHQSLHIMFHDGYPGHKLGPTLMCNPSPSTPSFLLHTHTPCPHKHCNHTTFLQDATFIPTQNGPFHSRREPVELRNTARCLFFHFLHSHSLSLSLPLCVFTDTDHEALKFNLLFIFLVRELHHPVLPASTCFNLVLKAVATFPAECQRVPTSYARIRLPLPSFVFIRILGVSQALL